MTIKVPNRFRKCAAMVVVGMFLLAGQIVFAEPEEGQFYRIKNVNSKKFLALDDAAKKAEGALIVQRASGEGERQQWKFVKNGDYYNIINRKSGQALNVQNESKDEGTPIIQWTTDDNNFENQQWSLEKKGKHYLIKARHSGLVVDVADASKERKAPLIQWPVNDGRNQIFELVPVKK